MLDEERPQVCRRCAWFLADGFRCIHGVGPHSGKAVDPEMLSCRFGRLSILAGNPVDYDEEDKGPRLLQQVRDHCMRQIEKISSQIEKTNAHEKEAQTRRRGLHVVNDKGEEK